MITIIANKPIVKPQTFTDLLNELSHLLKKKSYCFGLTLKTGSMLKKDSHSIKRFSHLEQRYE